jgi:hypothetical protein
MPAPKASPNEGEIMAATVDRSAFRRACACLALTLPILLTGCGQTTVVLSTIGSALTASASPAQSAAPSTTASTVATETAPPSDSGSALPSEAPTAVAPAVGTLYIRKWFVNPSIGPSGFFSTSTVVSSGRLYYVPDASGATPALLFTKPVNAAITQAGIATIAAAAQQAGLLGGTHDFECQHAANAGKLTGSGTTYLTIIVNGVAHNLSGSCQYGAEAVITPVPGAMPPGSYAAYMDFVTHIDNMIGWLGSDLGAPAAWTPTRLAVIAGVPGESDWWGPQVNTTDVATWHVGKFSSYGTASNAIGGRCAILSGADLAGQLPSLNAAHEGTVFADSTGAKRVLAVRVVMPDEPTTGICG